MRCYSRDHGIVVVILCETLWTKVVVVVGYAFRSRIRIGAHQRRISDDSGLAACIPPLMRENSS